MDQQSNGGVTVLRLYVAGGVGRSDRAVASMKQLCEARLSGRYELSVIDVLQDPHLAEAERIIATPTLIKDRPPPLRRIIGDLTDPDRVLASLHIA